MSDAERIMDRLRGRTRRAVTGADDEQGAVADAPPPPAEQAKPESSTTGAVRRTVTIPHAVAIATAWAWRFLLIAAAVGLAYWLLQYFSAVTVPLAIAVLITALATPLVDLLGRVMPRALATAVVVIGGLAAIAGMLALVGTQVATQFSDPPRPGG